MEALGIPIDVLTREETLLRVKTFLADPCFHHIATVNPEFLLESEKNPEFRTVLLAADLRIADGFGIVLAGLLQGKRIPRFPGADLMTEILHIANEKKLSIFLAVNKDGLSSFEEIRSALLKKYPQLIVRGADMDPKHSESYQLPVTSYQLVLCNFGAPTQEIFLSHLRKEPNAVRLAMGIGGSFDYLTGKKKRAPKLWQAVGLEWLWRFIQQPKRWRRIWNAVGIFPFRILSATIKR